LAVGDGPAIGTAGELTLTDTTRLAGPRVWLTLFGYESSPARADLVPLAPSVRFTRAMVSLFCCWALAPIVFFVPPHLPWVFGAVGGGLYLAWKEWRGLYQVKHLEAACPSCGKALSIDPGKRIRLPYTIVCYGCHQEPLLEAAGAAE
jgi:hypothetical protein